MTKIEAAELLLSQRLTWVVCSDCKGRFQLDHCSSCNDSGTLPDSEMWRAHEILELTFPVPPIVENVLTSVAVDPKDPTAVNIVFEIRLKPAMDYLVFETKA